MGSCNATARARHVRAGEKGAPTVGPALEFVAVVVALVVVRSEATRVKLEGASQPLYFP